MKKYTEATMFIRVNITPGNDGRTDYKNNIVKEIHISIDDLRIIGATALSAGHMVTDQIIGILGDIDNATTPDPEAESESE